MRVKVRVLGLDGKLKDFIVNSSKFKNNDIVTLDPETGRFELAVRGAQELEDLANACPRDGENLIH